jgi:hypothetical protein
MKEIKKYQQQRIAAQAMQSVKNLPIYGKLNCNICVRMYKAIQSPSTVIIRAPMVSIHFNFLASR